MVFPEFKQYDKKPRLFAGAFYSAARCFFACFGDDEQLFDLFK